MMDTAFCTRSVAVAALCLLACACAPAVDGSSPEATRASIDRIERDLSAEERDRLQEAIRFVVADTLGRSLAFGSGVTGDDVEQQIIAFLDGKNAGEIIAGAEILRARRVSARNTP